MTWADWASEPALGLVLVLWGGALSTRHWWPAWVASYVAQGLMVIAAVLYAVAHRPGQLGTLAALYASMWAARRLFRSDGPCAWIRCETSREPRAPRPAGGPTGFWDMWTAWAWRMNPVLAVLLWMAWGMVLGGLGLLAAATL